MPLIPYVVEKSGREERAMDIYSRLLKRPHRVPRLDDQRRSGQPDRRPTAVPAIGGRQGRRPPVPQLARRQRLRGPGHLRHHAVHHLRRGHLLRRPVRSMGAVLLCAGAAGKRKALPNARIMIHQPLAGMEGTAEEIMIHAKEFGKVKERSTHPASSTRAIRWRRSRRTPIATASCRPRKPGLRTDRPGHRTHGCAKTSRLWSAVIYHRFCLVAESGDKSPHSKKGGVGRPWPRPRQDTL